MTQQLVPVKTLKNQMVASAIQPYIERFNGKVTVLLPQMEDFELWSSYHTLNINLVQFKASAAHKIEGKFMHTKAMLDTIATHARAKVLEIFRPPTEDEHIYTREVTMEIILANGTPAQKKKEKTFDLRDNGDRANRSRGRLREQIAKALAKQGQYPKGLRPKGQNETDEDFEKRAEEYVENTVLKEMRQARVFGRETAESGAEARCLRSLMGLKLSWDEDEFEWPILIVTAKLDTTKIMREVGEKVFLEKLSQAAFAGMTGGQGTQGVSGFLEAMEKVRPEDIIEAQVQPIEEGSSSSEDSQIIMPDEEYADMIGAEYGEESILEQAATTLTEQQTQVATTTPGLLDSKQQKALTDFLAQKGYPGHKAVNSLLNSIWEGCHIGNVNTLQAKIACQYVRDVCAEEKTNAQRGDDKKNTATMQAWKDARKVLCRDAYRMVKDLDEYLEFMQGKPL